MLILLPTYGEAKALLDGPYPNDERPVDTHVAGRPVRAALCGFGPVAAGVLATHALGLDAPKRCVLAGIAGSFHSTELPVGALVRPREVVMADVGRGDGQAFLGPAALGFRQAPGLAGAADVVDQLVLPDAQAEGVLLTVAAASDGADMAAERLRRHPQAWAEDMEGFAVALACARLAVPLTILRGISNAVGEGDSARWERAPALAAVREALAAELRDAR